MKKLCLFLLFGIFMSSFAEAKDIEFEIGKLISEIEVQEMSLLRESQALHIDKMLRLVEETVFAPALASVAKSIVEEEGTVDQSYCLLNLDVKKIGDKVIAEYRERNLNPTDGYIAMGVTLALEECGVIQKEDRRSLYEVFKTTMMEGVVNYSYPDWEEEMHVKSKYY